MQELTLDYSGYLLPYIGPYIDAMLSNIKESNKRYTRIQQEISNRGQRAGG
jgi:hypothetical protein